MRLLILGMYEDEGEDGGLTGMSGCDLQMSCMHLACHMRERIMG